MKPLKAPGLDGLHAAFFQSHWRIVGPSLFQLVAQFFEEGIFEAQINETLITLIPKVPAPQNIKEFRPISLCTVPYKVITKVLANRLKSWLPHLVLPTQASFVAGRKITDNIIITQEVIHSMRSKRGSEGWMVIKVDLEKAYDWLR